MSTVTAQSSSRLGTAGAVILGIALALVGVYGYGRYAGVAPAAPTADAKAEITSADGAPIADAYANGDVIFLSADRSLVAARGEAIRWEVEGLKRSVFPGLPPEVASRSCAILVPPTGRYDVKVRLYVARRDAIDVKVISFVAGSGERPNPPPGPADPDKPLPPAPTGDIDPAIRKAAATYYAAIVGNFENASSKLGAANPTYADLTNAAAVDHDYAKAALAEVVGAVLKPTYDPTTYEFPDKAAAKAAYAKVANSLKAGLYDATAATR